MKQIDQHEPGASPLDQALDQALARALPPPRLPARFRKDLQAAFARAHEVPLAELQRRFEREQAERLAALQREYLRLTYRTLGAMLAGAFAAGALVAFAMPWLTAHFGADVRLIVACASAAAGLGIAYLAWLRARGAPVTPI